MDSISNLPYFSCQGFKSFYALISHPYLSIYTFYMFLPVSSFGNNRNNL